MVGLNGDLDSASRRSILQYAALTGGSGMLFSGVATAQSTENSDNNLHTSNDRVQLGDFESGRDGWKTDGGNKLERITDEQFPAGVSSGTHGLAVRVNGDLFPSIRKNSDVKDVDFVNNRFLHAHVFAIAEETDSDLRFQFRLHRKPTKGKKGATSGEKRGKKDEGPVRGSQNNVVKSEFKDVSQSTPQEIQWDLSDLPDDVLDSVKRVEIVWYLADHEPDGGPRGRKKGHFSYQGAVLFDDIRLSASAPTGVTKQQAQKKRELHRAHGMIVDRTFEVRSGNIERGTFRFSDGHTVAYEFEFLDAGGYRYTIDGETFVFDGGEGDE